MSQINPALNQFIQATFPMSQQHSETIVKLFQEKELSKNDFLLAEGKICNEYCFLEQGFMRAYTYDHEGNDVTIAFNSNNQVVCEFICNA